MPRRDPAAVQRARERKEQKAKEKARKASDAATEAGRAILDVVLDGGRNAQPTVNLPKAMAEFDEAIKLDPENADAYFCRGRCFQEQNNLEAALKDYAQCLTVNEAHVAALMQQGICFDTLGDTDSAMASYSRVLDVDPRNDAAFNLRGCALLSRRGGLGLKLRQVDYSAVESDFLAAVRCNENNYYALCNLGRLYDEHGFYEKAVQFYTRAMDVKDDYNYAAYRRGCAALTAVEEAWRKAERALATDVTAVVLQESCAAVPFATEAPRDAARVTAPKNVPPSLFSLPPISSKAARAGGAGGASGGGSAAQNRHGSGQYARGGGSAAQQHSSSAAGGAGAGAAGGATLQTLSELKQAEMEREAKKQIERERAEEKHFQQLKQLLATAIADFSRILAPLQEVEDRIKELPTLLHRAKAYFIEGQPALCEEDMAFVRKHLAAYGELQPAPPTSPAAVKAALELMMARLEAKDKLRPGQIATPFLAPEPSLRAALIKMQPKAVEPAK